MENEEKITPVDETVSEGATAPAEEGTPIPEEVTPPVEEDSAKVEEPELTAPGVATEPRLRFRGQVVLSESERFVAGRTFKHIRIADGSELDLTDAEYENEVRVSYPPVA